MPSQLDGVVYKGINVSNTIAEMIKPWQDRVARLKESIEAYAQKSAFAQNKDNKDDYIRQRHLLELECEYWVKKVNTFTRTEYTEGFRNNQLNDTRTISKYAFHYFKSVFRDVSVQRGETTALFRKILGIQNVYEKKDRNLHSHHAIDAAVLTLIPREDSRKALVELFYKKEEARKLNDNIAFYESVLNEKIEECNIPSCKNIVSYIENNIIVYHVAKDQTLTPSRRRIRRRGRVIKDKNGNPLWKTGDSIRGQLHKETFYGAIKLPVLDGNSITRDENGKFITEDKLTFVIRKELKYKANSSDSGFANLKKLEEAIVDKNLYAIIKSQIPEGVSFKDALENGIYMIKNGKNGEKIKTNRIRHIRCFAPTNAGPVDIKKQSYKSKQDYKNFYYATPGELPYMCVYEHTEKPNKRIFEPYNLLRLTLNKQNVGFQSTIVIKKDVYRLAQVLKRNDTILIYENSLEDVYNMDQEKLHSLIYTIDRFEKSRMYLYHMNCSKSVPNNRLKADFKNLEPTLLCSLSSIHWLTLGVDFEFDGNKIVFKNL